MENRSRDRGIDRRPEGNKNGDKPNQTIDKQQKPIPVDSKNDKVSVRDTKIDTKLNPKTDLTKITQGTSKQGQENLNLIVKKKDDDPPPPGTEDDFDAMERMVTQAKKDRKKEMMERNPDLIKKVQIF